MNETDPTADALVAEARRAVHESLILLPAWEADRVRALIADLETAVEFRAAASAVVSPPTDRAALRDRIAAALYERERPPRDPHWPDAYAMDRETFEAMADAVLAVLPEQTDRAAVYAEVADRLAADAEQGDKDGWTRIYRRSAATQVRAWGEELRRLDVEAHDTGTQQQGEAPAVAALQQEVKRLGLMVDEYGAGAGALTDKLKRVRDLHRETCPVAQAAVPSTAFKCGLCEVLDAPAAPVAQQPAAEAEQDDTVHACPGRWGGPNCRCFDAEPAPAEQQAAAADGEETPSRAVLLDLVRDFLDPDPCSFDHHGYCQAHGYLGGEPGSCPHGRARKLIPGIDEDATP